MDDVMLIDDEELTDGALDRDTRSGMCSACKCRSGYLDAELADAALDRLPATRASSCCLGICNSRHLDEWGADAGSV